MPRPNPFTQADIEARSRLTGLPQIADPEADMPACPPEGGITPAMRRGAWDFSAAMDTLRVRHMEDRRRCENELILICVINKQGMLAEAQETPGRKARALQLAPQKKRRQKPFLPQSLEQEAVRALGRIPQSRGDFALLRRKMMRMTRRGRYKSWALRNTIHALQACAATWSKNKLIWDESRRAPSKRLLKFIVQALGAANIQHPDPEENYSKFVSLMLRPRKPTERQVERPPEQPLSEAERRLAKVFL